MCMITHVPANVDLPEDGIYNGSVTNDDGHGFAIASARFGLEVYKSMAYDKTWKSLEEARARHGKNSVVLFHSRFGTHGVMSEFNVHPFVVGEIVPMEETDKGVWHAQATTVMAHNGVMPSHYHPTKGDRRSDTRVFVDHIAKHYCDNPNGVPSRRGAKHLANMIGSANKLVFLSVKTGEPKARIINGHLGDYTSGVWFSNSGYKFAPSWKRGNGWQSTSWWGDEDFYSNYHATQWDPQQKKWVATAPVVGGHPKPSHDECPMCGGEVDLASNFCCECDYCLDCTEYLDNCLCYMPRHLRDDSPEELVQIEDVADKGWVKVDGIWRMSNSLLDPRNDTTRVS